MACVELKVQFENAFPFRQPVRRREVENLRAALEGSLDETIRSLYAGVNRGIDAYSKHSEHLQSGLERSARGYVLFFQFVHAEPVSCRLFEQFATDVIQCAASTHLLAGSGLSIRSLLPHLYEDNVLLFWGSFTRHAPSSALTKLALYSQSCRFEKTLDPAEYETWVSNFDLLVERLSSGRSEVRDHPRPSHDSLSEDRELRHDRLAAVAEARDEDVFSRELGLIPRESLTQDEYLRLIRLALGAGAHRSARDLATDARSRFPDDAEVHQFSKILGPPAPVASEEPPSSFPDEYAWLKSNAAEFGGQWVVLRDGDLVGSGASLSHVRDEIGSLSGLFVTKVP